MWLFPVFQFPGEVVLRRRKIAMSWQGFNCIHSFLLEKKLLSATASPESWQLCKNTSNQQNLLSHVPLGNARRMGIKFAEWLINKSSRFLTKLSWCTFRPCRCSYPNTIGRPNASGKQNLLLPNRNVSRHLMRILKNPQFVSSTMRCTFTPNAKEILSFWKVNRVLNLGGRWWLWMLTIAPFWRFIVWLSPKSAVCWKLRTMSYSLQVNPIPSEHKNALCDGIDWAALSLSRKNRRHAQWTDVTNSTVTDSQLRLKTVSTLNFFFTLSSEPSTPQNDILNLIFLPHGLTHRPCNFWGTSFPTRAPCSVRLAATIPN